MELPPPSESTDSDTTTDTDDETDLPSDTEVEPPPTTTTTTTTTTPATRFIDLSVSFVSTFKFFSRINSLTALGDGSFFLCLMSSQSERWLFSNEGSRLIGTTRGHRSFILCALMLDDNTLVTGATDRTIMVWNIPTLQCLNVIKFDTEVCCLVGTKDQSMVMCGLGDGRIEFRSRTTDLELKSTISLYDDYDDSIYCIYELRDGSFVSGTHSILKRCDATGAVIRNYLGHKQWINHIIGLKSDAVLVSADQYTIRMWDVSTGECLRILTDHTDAIRGLMKLSENVFASVSRDKTIRVWSKAGCIETIRTRHKIDAMTRLGDSIVTSGPISGRRGLFEVRQLT